MTSDNLRAIADQVTSDFQKSLKRPAKDVCVLCRMRKISEFSFCHACNLAWSAAGLRASDDAVRWVAKKAWKYATRSAHLSEASRPPMTETGGSDVDGVDEVLIIPHAVALRHVVEQREKERLEAEKRRIDLRPLWRKIHAALAKAMETGTEKTIYIKFTTPQEKRIAEVIERLKQAGYDATRDGWNLRIRFDQATDPDQGEYELKNITINENGEAS